MRETRFNLTKGLPEWRAAMIAILVFSVLGSMFLPPATTSWLPEPLAGGVAFADDPPTASFSSATYSAGEADGTATITVSLSGTSAAQITVNYATSDGTAAAGSDYTAASGTLTFAAGTTNQTFDVTITNDTTVEDSETVSLAISNPTNATLGTQSTATLTITDNDVPSVAFSSATYTVNEGSPSATITAELSVAGYSTITVNYATSDGTAIAGSDYTATSGTLTFAASVTSQTFDVTITDDSSVEGSETVILTLSNATNAAITGNNPDVRIFVRYHRPDEAFLLENSVGLQKGMVGIVNARAGRRQQGSNNVIIAHEFLHTLGATDKYDPSNGQPIPPDGLGEPDRKPLYPQRYAEIMGGRVALADDDAVVPKSLNYAVIGSLTAGEIRLID